MLENQTLLYGYMETISIRNVHVYSEVVRESLSGNVKTIFNVGAVCLHLAYSSPNGPQETLLATLKSIHLSKLELIGCV